MIATLCVLALIGPKPLMKDFIGLNVHTVLFKPNLYRPIASVLRNYHPYNWDIGDDTGAPLRFPLAQNNVDWADLYGGWKKAGYRTDACVMFEQIAQDKWKDVERDGRRYGREFAKQFGPSSSALVESIEIGNEPGKLDDDFYRKLFKNTAEGIREGDPKLTIATCATFDKPSGDYHKSLSCFQGLESLYDVISVHSYPQLEGWPTWRRSYPEDERMPFLKDLQGVIDWRNRNAPGKPVWLTEFGYDSSTQKPDPKGDMKDWVGVTDEQQAQWIVRGFLTLAGMDLDRAYLYWFNDDDQPSLHAASGLTRRYAPKPSFWAVAHLQKSLGDTRFVRVVETSPRVYEFANDGQTIWVAWSLTGDGTRLRTILAPGKAVARAELMPTKEGSPELVPFRVLKGLRVEIEVGETPVYLFMPAQ